MAARNLTTPIPVPNINKVRITEVNDLRDIDVDPRFSIKMQFTGVGGRDAGTHTIIARDTLNSQGVMLNASPTGYGDIILSGGSQQVAGACTSLALAWDTAYDATVGTKTAKRRAGDEAALTAAQTIGLVSAGLWST